MGKSGKKSKSDKVNALRKQYDAFLEEDKKRKDRNEYILGRMETMRSCTSLVPVRSKAYRQTDSNYPTQPQYKNAMAQISNSAITLSGGTHVTTKYSNKNYDEPSLLREISKKYFLIPKVMSNVIYNVNYKENEQEQSPTDDTDWKSKYNILDELKREEKEDQSNNIYEKQNSKMDSYKDNKNSEYIQQENKVKLPEQDNSTLHLEHSPSKAEIDTFTNKKPTFNNSESKRTQNKDEQVDKTLYSENIGATPELNMEKKKLVPQSNKLHEDNLSAHSSLPKSQVENNITRDSMLLSSNDNIHDINKANELFDEKLTPKMDTENYESNKYLPEEKKCIDFNESQDGTAHCTLNDVNKQFSPIMNKANVIDDNNENNVVSVKSTEENHEFVHNEHPKAQGVYEEVAGHLENPVTNNTEQQEYLHQESDLNQIQNIEHNVTSEVNDELEIEQKEMFYSEDNDKTNENNENADPTTYPAENENYINQEYSYYDESQKEQTYPTEINEHEESTERYDQNYEQQYVNNYDHTMNTTQYETEQYNAENSYDQQQNMYDQQQGDVNYQPENSNYEYAPNEDPVKDSELNQNAYYTNAPQENAQYENQQLENTEVADQSDIAYVASEDYDAQQEYITMHAEAAPIENVEQQLDEEDGYVINSVGAENQDYQEQVIEETAPEIQQTDVKVT